MIPPTLVEPLELRGPRPRSIFIVRDDLIEGGTKRRIIDRILESDPAEELVYASPAFGYAQIAVALGARARGRRATIFVAKRSALHPRTAAALRAGARIIQVPHGYLSNVQAKARAYAGAFGARLLPFGLACEEALEGIASAARATGILEPPEVWCVAGSGTLARGLRRAWPRASLRVVRIGAVPSLPPAGPDGLGVEILHATEGFEEAAEIRPPFPSCPEYDAKAWRFLEPLAAPGAVFWNVAA